MQHIPSRTEIIDIRGLRYNIRHWGDEGAPKVFFLHGWMDSSATFQFVVDALGRSWHVIAPDWRGYGASQWLSRPYWFPDYYADLDCLLQLWGSCSFGTGPGNRPQSGGTGRNLGGARLSGRWSGQKLRPRI